MAINRAPFNALVDDDGSGASGSVWDKSKIASVILDPIDALLTEGGWTVQLTSTGGGAPLYVVQQGVFVKNGRQVFVNGRIVLSGVGSLAAGNLGITLPFAGGNLYSPGSIEVYGWNNFVTAMLRMRLLVVANQEAANLFRYNTAAVAAPLPVALSDITGSLDISFAGSYMSAS
jgi:hypothetical protein